MPIPRPRLRANMLSTNCQHHLTLLTRTTLALFPHQLRFLTASKDHDKPVERSQTARRLNFGASPARRYPSLSPLFALSQLSNARESQALAKTSRLSRVEHSPSLQLIRSAEVEQLPFVTTSNSAKGSRELREARLQEWARSRTGRSRRDVHSAGLTRERQTISAAHSPTGAAEKVEEQSLKHIGARYQDELQRGSKLATAVGTAVLENQRQRRLRLQRQLAAAHRQRTREAAQWDGERRQLVRERRTGALIVFAAAIIGTSALAWRLSDSSAAKSTSAAPLSQWQQKWRTQDTQLQQLASIASSTSPPTDVYKATRWVCHEPGCGEPEFGSQDSFNGHYWHHHPEFMTHLQDGIRGSLASRWICHESGCGEAEFWSQNGFNEHYWQRHPELMSHLEAVKSTGRSSSRVSTDKDASRSRWSWFWG